MSSEVKPKYCIRNWSQYNKSLIQRGSITLWFSEDSIKKWHQSSPLRVKGRPQLYSDDAILCALFLQGVYKLTLRSLQGFLLSLVSLLDLNLKIPSYTQISRRAASLGKTLKRLSNKKPKDIVFDSTGFKVYGEGEWKVRQQGASKRRTWRKFHIVMDPDSGEVIVAEMTSNGVGAGDAETAKKLIPRLPKGVQKIYGDGAYDGIAFRQAIESIGAKPIIPPPRGAIVHDKLDSGTVERNNAIKAIVGLGGDDEARKIWKILTGYHERSLVETTMYRLKQITGDTLRSRSWEQQSTECFVKCLIINKMTKLGMPKGEWTI